MKPNTIYSRLSLTSAEVNLNSMVECGKELTFKTNDPVRCTNCGYRILYKKRAMDDKEPIQYEAI
jgi:DNA-directed RNA polymerase subunit RPC12/RpoP